jgi:hypothetical protein
VGNAQFFNVKAGNNVYNNKHTCNNRGILIVEVSGTVAIGMFGGLGCGDYCGIDLMSGLVVVCLHGLCLFFCIVCSYLVIHCVK